MTKLITVFGSTGNQGGSVVRAILNHPQLSKEWKVRGVTRNPDKPDAQAMVAKGVEMVTYWEMASLAHEVQQGRNLTDACIEAKVPHLLWSSLPRVSKITGGRLANLHHFDSKAMVEEYINEAGQPASFVLPGYFMTNVPGSIKPSQDDGAYTLSLLFHPDTRIPMLDVPTDFGKFVASCLADPKATIGKHVLAVSAWVTPLDVCAAVVSVTGKSCEFREVADEEWKSGQELLENMIMIKEWAYYGPGADEGVKWSQETVNGVGGWDGFGNFEAFLGRIGFV
ncbi:unnamed protein product [Alternaria alternata]